MNVEAKLHEIIGRYAVDTFLLKEENQMLKEQLENLQSQYNFLHKTFEETLEKMEEGKQKKAAEEFLTANPCGPC